MPRQRADLRARAQLPESPPPPRPLAPPPLPLPTAKASLRQARVARAQLGRGLFALARGDYDRATAAARRAALADPQLAPAQLLLGKLLLLQGAAEGDAAVVRQASGALATAAWLDPNLEEARLMVTLLQIHLP